jgi:hypothetical protein
MPTMNIMSSNYVEFDGSLDLEFVEIYWEDRHGG